MITQSRNQFVWRSKTTGTLQAMKESSEPTSQVKFIRSITKQFTKSSFQRVCDKRSNSSRECPVCACASSRLRSLEVETKVAEILKTTQKRWWRTSLFRLWEFICALFSLSSHPTKSVSVQFCSFIQFKILSIPGTELASTRLLARCRASA